MSETVRLWLLAMIDGELKNIVSDVSNNRVWQRGCEDEETVSMYEQNIADLEEYKEVLLGLREQAVEGELKI